MITALIFGTAGFFLGKNYGKVVTFVADFKAKIGL